MWPSIKGDAQIIDKYHSDTQSSKYYTVQINNIVFHYPDDDNPDWRVWQCYLVMVAAGLQCYLVMVAAATEVEAATNFINTASNEGAATSGTSEGALFKKARRE